MPTPHDHDLPTGDISRCQICGSEDLVSIINLGSQPLCDSLLSEAQLNEPEAAFPLHLFRCPVCSLAQIDHVVDPATVFHREYPYRGGITREVAEHLVDLAATLVDDYNLDPGTLVVDIGCNDGTLLSEFNRRGMRGLGVEPTDIASFARRSGVDVVQDYFSESLSIDIRARYGEAKAITATNVFAHVANLGSVMRGITALLADDGIFVSESHYLKNILESVQFDTVYHEHLRSYSLKSIITLFEMYGLRVIDAEIVGRYAGSVRVTATRSATYTRAASVDALLAEEDAFGLYGDSVYKTFRDNSVKAKDDLLALAQQARANGESFVGNSCPGRCSTLLNFAGIDRQLMPYICEQPTSLKIGLYLPGMHIPIVNNERLVKEQPDYIVLLAWHLEEPIVEELRGKGIRSKLVVPLPDLKILHS